VDSVESGKRNKKKKATSRPRGGKGGMVEQTKNKTGGIAPAVLLVPDYWDMQEQVRRRRIWLIHLAIRQTVLYRTTGCWWGKLPKGRGKVGYV